MESIGIDSPSTIGGGNGGTGIDDDAFEPCIGDVDDEEWVVLDDL